MDNKGFIIIWDWRFFVIVGIIILIWWIYPSLIWGIYPSTESGENLEEEIDLTLAEVGKLLEEKPNIDPEAYYWKDLPIHYYFSEVYPCEDNRRTQVIESFNIIEKETDKIVTFYEERNEYGIEISCYEEYETEEASGYGGIEFYDGEKEILNGFVELYKPDPVNFEICESYPSLVLHEILHAMGFDHIDSGRSIMNSVVDLGESCIEIDIEIVDCLKHIYSNGQGNYTCEGIPFIE